MVLQKKMEFEGKDVADAISKACKALNVSQEDLDIEVLTTGTSGIFGLCRQKTRLRVAIKEGEGPAIEDRPPAKAEKKPREEKPRRPEKKKRPAVAEKKQEAVTEPPVQVPEPAVEGVAGSDYQVDEALLVQVKTDLSRLLELMNFPSEVIVSSDQENVIAQIKGEFVNDIVGENGKILDSLQYILRKMTGKNFPDKAIISLDAGDFRANRDEELRETAHKYAAEVKKNGKTRSIPSLNPYERRIVHITLQDDKDVRSRSVGDGLLKKVLIYRPGKGRKTSARRRKGGRSKK